MITKQRIAELRACHERFVNGHGTAADGAVILHNTTELLDAAESANELRVKLDEAIDFIEGDGVKCRTYSKTSCRSEHPDDLCRSCKRFVLIARLM